MWSVLWLCPDWTVSSTATLANVPYLCGRAGAGGGSPEKAPPVCSPLHIAREMIFRQWREFMFLPGSAFCPLSPSHSRGEVTAGFLFQTLSLSLPLDCCSFSPFLFFFYFPCNVRPPAALCMSQASTRPLSFAVSISRRLKHKENVYIVYIRKPKRWIPHPPRSEGCDKWREIREREKVGKLDKKEPKRTILLEFIQLTTRCLPLSSSKYLGVVSTSTHFR